MPLLKHNLLRRYDYTTRWKMYKYGYPESLILARNQKPQLQWTSRRHGSKPTIVMLPDKHTHYPTLET